MDTTIGWLYPYKNTNPEVCISRDFGGFCYKDKIYIWNLQEKRDIIDEIQIWRTTQRDENTTQKANEELISTTQKEDLSTQKSKITT